MTSSNDRTHLDGGSEAWYVFGSLNVELFIVSLLLTSGGLFGRAGSAGDGLFGRGGGTSDGVFSGGGLLGNVVLGLFDLLVGVFTEDDLLIEI